MMTEQMVIDDEGLSTECKLPEIHFRTGAARFVYAAFRTKFSLVASLCAVLYGGCVSIIIASGAGHLRAVLGILVGIGVFALIMSLAGLMGVAEVDSKTYDTWRKDVRNTGVMAKAEHSLKNTTYVVDSYDFGQHDCYDIVVKTSDSTMTLSLPTKKVGFEQSDGETELRVALTGDDLYKSGSEMFKLYRGGEFPTTAKVWASGFVLALPSMHPTASALAR